MASAHPGRTFEYHGAEGSDLEGAWIKVRQVRIGADVEALISAAYVADLHAVMAPFILDWNLSGKQIVEVEVPAIVRPDGTEAAPARTRKESRDTELPAPADAGPDVLLAIDNEVRNWIVTCLLESLSGKTDPKALTTPSSPSPSGAPEAAKETTSPRRRGSSQKR